MAHNLTDHIYQLNAPYDNPYQGTDKRLLFVCSAGLLRSATAANLYAKLGYNTRNCGTHEYALIPLTTNLIYWAHEIYFVNLENKQQADATFLDCEYEYARIQKAKVLNIPDNYNYNNPELIQLLKDQIGQP